MSTATLIDAVLKKFPKADPSTVLDLIVACEADLNRVFALLDVQAGSRKRQLTFDNLTTKKPAKAMKTSAELVSLYNSKQVEDARIFCSMYENVLDPSVANRLGVELERQAQSWEYQRFYLFEREVTSGHRSALYTDDQDLLSGKTEASYQGRRVAPGDMFEFPTEMKVARDIVESIVARYVPDWKSSVVVTNCYANRNEKLDYHSDQLTHIGTRPTIASLSLGCAREFRLKDRSVPPRRPTYSILVPHNSLIIMHGGCQERFKHCVPVARAIDPDPLIGTTRISLTFRMYLPELNDKTIPRCSCNTPMVLRNTLPNSNGDYKYIWQCAQHYADGKGCNGSKNYSDLQKIRPKQEEVRSTETKLSNTEQEPQSSTIGRNNEIQ